MATILAVQEIDVSSHIHVVGCEAPCDDCCAEPAHGLLPLIMIGHVSHLECHAGWRSQQTAAAIGGWWLGGLTAATECVFCPAKADGTDAALLHRPVFSASPAFCLPVPVAPS